MAQVGEIHTGESYPPGVVILGGGLQPRVAMALRVVWHSGASLEQSPGNAWRCSFTAPARCLWVGWYSSQVLANGWEPFDQPHPAAYVPLGYRHLSLAKLRDQSLVFHQTRPQSITRVTGTSSIVIPCSESELRGRIEALLDQASFTGDHADETLRFLLTDDALRSCTNAA